MASLTQLVAEHKIETKKKKKIEKKIRHVDEMSRLDLPDGVRVTCLLYHEIFSLTFSCYAKKKKKERKSTQKCYCAHYKE